jgi:hypothetical protein
LVMMIGGAIVVATWSENYGSIGQASITQQFRDALVAIATGNLSLSRNHSRRCRR